MNGRQRILAAFAGEAPDTVPFSPNLYQWFYQHLAFGTLPEELREATHPLDALRVLGADVLARWDSARATGERLHGIGQTDEYPGGSSRATGVTTAFNDYPAGCDRRRRTYHTRHGELTESWLYSSEAGADFQEEFCWKRWEDYAAVRDLLESREYWFDRERFRFWQERVGLDGVAVASVTQSPLKTFHWLAGAENASYFLADHPGEMRELAAIHEERALAVVTSAADAPETTVLLSLDNLDSLFYSPRYYRNYCESFFRRAAEIAHARGKVFGVHACGRNRRLLPLAGASRVDWLEGITPAPLGDVDLAQARELAGRPSFTVNGGIDGLLLETREEACREIHDYTRKLFARMGDKRHFVFASSCSTAPRSPWENLKHFRDAAREYGRL